jgi:hypothetical protein
MDLRSSPRRFTPFAEIPESYEYEPSPPGSRRETCRWRYALLAAVVAMLLAGPSAARGKEKTLDQLGRIELIRGLDREIAVAKIVLPRGKHGVFIDNQGQLDEALAQKELRMNGPGVSAGMPVEITKITFKPHRIIFELNGGGKKHEKWYQHIQIVGAGVSQPVTQQDTSVATGSYITLTFEDGKVPNLSVEQTKKLLDVVLDFHRQAPTVLYAPSLPKKFKEAIKKHQVLVGMNRDAVLSAKGPPFRKVRETKPNGEETEDWLYGLPPHVLFVTFENDSVVKVHQY